MHRPFSYFRPPPVGHSLYFQFSPRYHAARQSEDLPPSVNILYIFLYFVGNFRFKGKGHKGARLDESLILSPAVVSFLPIPNFYNIIINTTYCVYFDIKFGGIGPRKRSQKGKRRLACLTFPCSPLALLFLL